MAPLRPNLGDIDHLARFEPIAAWILLDLDVLNRESLFFVRGPNCEPSQKFPNS